MRPERLPKIKLTRATVLVCVGILCTFTLLKSGKSTNYAKLLRSLNIQETVGNEFKVYANTEVIEQFSSGACVSSMLTNYFLHNRTASAKRKSSNVIVLSLHFYSLNSIHAP